MKSLFALFAVLALGSAPLHAEGGGDKKKEGHASHDELSAELNALRDAGTDEDSAESADGSGAPADGGTATPDST